MRGVVRRGMGRKRFCGSVETTGTRLPHNKCVRTTTFSSGYITKIGKNGSCIEDIWKNFKDIVFDGIELFVPHKILKPNPDPEYYKKEVMRLKVKVRKTYNKRKLGEPNQAELKRLS